VSATSISDSRITVLRFRTNGICDVSKRKNCRKRVLRRSAPERRQVPLEAIAIRDRESGCRFSSAHYVVEGHKKFGFLMRTCVAVGRYKACCTSWLWISSEPFNP
jgi:hypothetical protein